MNDLDRIGKIRHDIISILAGIDNFNLAVELKGPMPDDLRNVHEMLIDLVDKKKENLLNLTDELIQSLQNS